MLRIKKIKQIHNNKYNNKKLINMNKKRKKKRKKTRKKTREHYVLKEVNNKKRRFLKLSLKKLNCKYQNLKKQ